MDIFVGRLRGRALWLAEFITTFVALILMIFLIWGTWAHFARSFDFAAPLWSRDSTIDIALPLWPSKLLAPVAFGILSCRLVIQLIGYGKGIIAGGDPVAVPLPRSVADQAAEEAAHVSGADE